jgi:Ca2+-binding RTX toxin-like protein
MGTYIGTTGDDFIVGSGSADYISGGPNSGLGEDFLMGGGGNDTIYGGLEDDYLSGGDGDDTFIIHGVDGWDTFSGGSGTDTISIENVSSYAYYSLLKIDSMSSIERIENNDIKDAVIEINGSMNFSSTTLVDIDEIRGSKTGADTIWGSQGDDHINGRGGDDVLEGEGGDDTLEGGTGADTFVFQDNDGEDTILDFADGTDLIRLENTSASDISDLTITNVAGDAKIEIDSTTIILESFDIADLTNADFDFV